MATTMPGKHGGTLRRLEKGESGNLKGRPKKFICALKNEGYTQSQIHDTIRVMLSLNYQELGGVFKNEKATVLEKAVAAAIQKDIQKGQLLSMESLLNRTYGRPKDTVEHTGKDGAAIQFQNLNISEESAVEILETALASKKFNLENSKKKE